MKTLALYHNPEVFETLPNARLTGSARDVFDILYARQEPGGTVLVTQKELGERLGISQSHVSRAIGELKDKGLIAPRTRQGRYTIHPLLAGYESETHYINTVSDPETAMWPLSFPAGLRPPRRNDPRAGTLFDPDPDGGGEPQPSSQEPRRLYLVAS